MAVLEGIIAETGILSTCVRCDNGSEFIAGGLVDWCNTVGVLTAFIDSGSSWQNGCAESFNAQFRREQLSGGTVDTMVESRYLAGEWKDIYNQVRPHGSLDEMTPSGFGTNGL